jgi:hypothetical protein
MINQEDKNQIQEKSDIAMSAHNQPDDVHSMNSHPGDVPPPQNLPDVSSEEEIKVTRGELFKMILGGYVSMLPALGALLLTFLIIYLLFR